MPHHSPHAHNLSDFEHSSRAVRMAGWAVLAAGVLLCLPVVLGVRSAPEGIYSPAEKTQTIVIGCLCVLSVTGMASALLLTAKKRVWVDFESGTLGTVSQALGFQRRKELPLTSDGHVIHREKVVSSGEHETRVWVIEYACADGSLELHRQSDSIRGRAWAERMAEHLDLKLVEAVDGTFTVRDVADLDASVIDQGLAEGLEWPNEKISRRVHWSPRAGDAVEIAIQPPGFGWNTAFGLGVLAVLLVIILPEIDLSPEPWHIGAIIAVLIQLVVLGAMGTALVLIIRNALVRVERWTIAGEGVAPSERASALLPAALIEQVEARQDGSLSVRSDSGSHTLGTNLSRQELRALRSLVLLVLSTAKSEPDNVHSGRRSACGESPPQLVSQPGM